MSSQVEKVVRETEEALKSMLPKDQWDEIDLSYITQELIAEHEQDSAEKSQDEVRKQKQGFPETPVMLAWCYWGNSLYKNGDWYHWENGNSNDGCDSIMHTCQTGYKWKSKLTKTIYVKCPQGGGFAGN